MKTTRRNFIQRTFAVAGLAIVGPVLPARSLNALPKVLILGDSISVGYTPFVQEILHAEADVVRPAENCQGTKNGVMKIDEWLGQTRWHVIHFNFGLHDLKHVDPVTGINSTKPEDPQQSDVKQYANNLKIITERLKASGAKLIFATTTPFPDKPDGPLRRSDQVSAYNKAALKIMKKNRIAIDDLYSFALPEMNSLQIPKNVHFTKDGSLALAMKVAESIRNILKS